VDLPRNRSSRVVQHTELIANLVEEPVNYHLALKLVLGAGVGKHQHFLIVQDAGEGQNARLKGRDTEMDAVPGYRAEVKTTIAQRRAGCSARTLDSS
jgi:hypothetical protein